MRPPVRSTLALALAFTLALAAGLAGATAHAAPADIEGAWKLLLVGPFLETDFLLVEVKGHGGKFDLTVKDFARQFPQPPTVSVTDAADDAVRLSMKILDTEGSFAGKRTKQGAFAGQLRVNDQAVPARLERTKAEKLTPPPQQAPAAAQAYFTSARETDPKARVRTLREIAAGNPGSPTMTPVYTDLIRLADPAGLGEAEVRKIVEEWVNGANAYGDVYAAEVRLQAFQGLNGKKAFAPLALSLARDADKALGPDSPLKARADVARALAEAATLASDDRLAASARARSEVLEAELDVAYRKKVPPFKPEPANATGRNRGPAGRAVLFELFTGAQCPPCVAADVAFDVLNESVPPAELVTLQYHLHVPGPDPLTNADSVARAEYYPSLQGTPSTFFDGASEAPGGGPMSNAKNKYDEFRAVLEKALARPAGATIDLKVRREADAITIKASARANTGQEGKTSDALKLRLALVEDEVRYVGGNSLRFHHHVVRSMPGGVDGKALPGGKGTAEETVRLVDLRKSLEQYLTDFNKEGQAFPKSPPPIKLDRLSVVAFVQDDDTKKVLNAVLVPVEPAAR